MPGRESGPLLRRRRGDGHAGGRPGYTRIRTPYVSDADAARIAETTSHLTADPALLLDALLDTAGRTAPDDTPVPLIK